MIKFQIRSSKKTEKEKTRQVNKYKENIKTSTTNWWDVIVSINI